MTIDTKLAVELNALGCTVEPGGSRVTCDPAPTDTDYDYLVVSPWRRNRPEKLLEKHGYTLDSRAYATQRSDFKSWRNGDVNLIVTTSEVFAAKHRVATALCRRLNLLNKPDRIAVFQAVLYGKHYDG